MDETQVQPTKTIPSNFSRWPNWPWMNCFLRAVAAISTPDAARTAFKDIEHHTLLTVPAMQERLGSFRAAFAGCRRRARRRRRTATCGLTGRRGKGKLVSTRTPE
ncbi:hypothetical protein ACWGTO_29600 [Mesorhizobium sp. PL10]